MCFIEEFTKRKYTSLLYTTDNKGTNSIYGDNITTCSRLLCATERKDIVTDPDALVPKQVKTLIVAGDAKGTDGQTVRSGRTIGILYLARTGGVGGGRTMLPDSDKDRVIWRVITRGYLKNCGTSH